MKDDKNMPEKLPEELQKIIDEGKGFAFPKPKPSITGRIVSIALALFVVAAVLPYWAGLSTLMYYCLLGGAVSWMLLAKVYSNRIDYWKIQYAVVEGMFKHVTRVQGEMIKDQALMIDELRELSDD